MNGFRINSKSWIVVRGFTVVDTTGHGINVTKSAHILIEDNEVCGAGEPALATTVSRGISLATTTDSIVQRNNVHDNSDAGIFLGVGSTGNRHLRQHELRERPRVHPSRSRHRRPGRVEPVVNANLTFDNEDSGINIWEGAARRHRHEQRQLRQR